MTLQENRVDPRSENSNFTQVAEGIFTLAHVLEPAECDALIASTEVSGYEDAPITTPWGFQMRPDIRNNTRVMLDDPGRAAALWERLRAWIPSRDGAWRAVGLNERFRFYRYEAGQYFDWHGDGVFRRNDLEQSRLTLMIYLNDTFQGGETQFDAHTVVPKCGSALIFEHRLLHRGAMVTEGVKYVMRSDVMYRRA